MMLVNTNNKKEYLSYRRWDCCLKKSKTFNFFKLNIFSFLYVLVVIQANDNDNYSHENLYAVNYEPISFSSEANDPGYSIELFGSEHIMHERHGYIYE